MNSQSGLDLICGEAIEELSEMAEGQVDMVLADPPYGYTQNTWDTRIPFDSMWQQLARIIKPSGVIVLNATQPFTSELIHSNLKMFKYCWAWNKVSPSGHLNAKKRPMRKIEDVCVFYTKQCTYNPQGLVWNPRIKSRSSKSQGSECYGKHGDSSVSNWQGYPTNLLEFKNENGLHPTQRPVTLMEYLIKTYTNEGELVVDFTMGSGTTGIACINTNRKFIGIELDPKYFEIAKSRCAKVLTGGLKNEFSE